MAILYLFYFFEVAGRDRKGADRFQGGAFPSPFLSIYQLYKLIAVRIRTRVFAYHFVLCSCQIRWRRVSFSGSVAATRRRVHSNPSLGFFIWFSSEVVEKMISAGINLVMTVIGFAVSTMFIVFVCTRLICARIQLQASRRSFPAASRSDLSIMERGVHGLEPVVVSSFPTKFVDQFAYGQDTQCAICLSEYQEKDILRVLPYCGHAFHVYCIDTWLRQHWTCPVCRISLRNSPDRRRKTPPAQNSSLRPLFRENFVSESYHYQFGVDNFSSSLIPDPARADDTVSSTPEVNCSTELVKQMESPSNS
ncbi:hypothetical protein KFK09_023146 [Dendrobium nobile]|uniref:RING-type domain-containing protein n=1 Tax=Dendrobium nobile TaxID=94219 RepID=A0A8T3ALY0_DENNO|nr:hypothetical protein KFK09_023146 [Dendrobium nobile]